MKLVVVASILFSFLLVDELEELRGYIEKVESGNMDIPYEVINSYEKIIPNNPIYLYLRGLIEIDGNKITFVAGTAGSGEYELNSSATLGGVTLS